ncbi:hypothetical protein AVEN_165619-1 [Araneus ventricosus]|uniref:Tc1-like transposase DDE domain-containing protein n=1 Tax=Araneus ventricosus TaxID=182803 RepID=A0A4Y2MG61_ARAVE|nr:hypothetical protein AVEN_165619-1 [Araneus ventricosus]
MKQWTLNARLGLYKTMAAQLCSGVFSFGSFWDLWYLYPQAIRYVEFLGDHLHPFILYCHPHRNGAFQQDNCTSHRSPDLNPIDHLWDILEKGVKAHHTTPATLTELWKALADVWQAIPVERFLKLVESMSRRVAAVITARGGPSRY